ncbi:hypothetical protein POM88_018473 [Heracleum sosnowskyi]|uniref:Uncharacterized protein n=1 Tax=Heracleum sosnowskyi TaxID=360622 RepID=A0AAD8IUI7_9APIA|nr:hypothetical protein POM88_018473 [Heracleum sosnowskyi]
MQLQLSMVELKFVVHFSFGGTSKLLVNSCIRFQAPDLIAGPISFRVNSGLSFDLKNQERPASVKDPVFSAEYALQVLGSAKATAWYSPKQKEIMIGLRFFEK